PGDVVGIGIHTGNALRGYELGRMARERGAYVVYGGIHATLFPEEAFEHGDAQTVVKGDGDEVWPMLLQAIEKGTAERLYEGGRLDADRFRPARWDLLPADRYMMASVQTVRGCPKHCSFCSVWRTDGQKPRQRASDAVIREIVDLRRQGFRFVLLADDNFYPVTNRDIELAERQGNTARVEQLRAIRTERFELLSRLAALPDDMMFFTQITMEAAEDEEFLEWMRKGKVRGALVGVESVTEEGLKAVYKDFNESGDALIAKLRKFREHGVYILGSFIFGLPTDRDDTFDATVELAQKADTMFAQFVPLTPHPGTVDFQRWEKEQDKSPTLIDGIPLTRYWLLPHSRRPKLCMPHPTMTAEEVRLNTLGAWTQFYSFSRIWSRAKVCTVRLRSRLMFLMISKLFLQMYAQTGMATDSARKSRANGWARWWAKRALPLFKAPPRPDLQVPGMEPATNEAGL
ncbi:MAG: B12-binding domain-containing radical SAM protein, partial [Acidobacteria bacterium]|nr:B12-binding domain-containing radical SAM protein [Acidobacteriota bacterium]